MHLPNFSSIKPESIVAELKQLLQRQRDGLKAILEHKGKHTWDTLMHPLEEQHDELAKMWSPISHLHSVRDNPELRNAYNEAQPLLTDFYTEIGQNQALFAAMQQVHDDAESLGLDKAQRKVLENDLRDFRLSGVALSDQDKATYAELSKKLSRLCTKFEENVLDATMGWKKHIENEALLKGLPEHAKQSAEAAAKRQQLLGWLLTLEFPSYLAVMTHATNRELRQELYTAFVTRASDQGPSQWDNSKIMHDILETRLALAKLLGFSNYAERSLATKMVKDPQQVLGFLQHLAEKSHIKAKAEYAELAAFAKEELGINDMQAWDITYVSEKFRQKRFAISQEELRPYFYEPKVLDGLFKIVEKLFHVRITPVKEFDRYHDDLKCYAMHDADGALRSYFYFDLYAREGKRGGAWMDDCRVRRIRADGSVQVPVAYVNCNFNRPVGNDPALFSHEEVVTLFHEFGHALQHMLTTVDYASVSGINGVPWDAVEVASQFLENWAWQKESLSYIAEHYETKEPLPDDLFQRMHKARNFQSAMAMVRQIEFSLFDFRLHLEFTPNQPGQIQLILDEVRQQISVIPTPHFNRFQHGFSHIFGGGYAAGYYSYKWAEVMAADAFDLFLETDIFDSNSSDLFCRTFLQSGGVEDPLDLFVAFRGREPSVDALLKQSGIIN